MRIIGLIGGMSWESSIEYYRIINEAVKAKLGGLHSAKSLMYSVDFAEIETLQHQAKWGESAQILIEAAQSLERGGANFIIICTNTMHKVADIVEAQINIPILHIADATAKSIQSRGLKRVGLLGTRFTMEEDFYKGRLIENHGLDVIVPASEDRDLIHQVIYEELCLGEMRKASKVEFIRVMNQLVENGAEGIILGCTEIGLLVNDKDIGVPLFDTTKIHAEAAVDLALKHSELPIYK
jgi:aspartate racemase